VVIVDNTNEDVDRVIMSDDTTGTGIKIPSMLIGKADGMKIKSFIADHD
jgi:hypothetical protein